MPASAAAAIALGVQLSTSEEGYKRIVRPLVFTLLDPEQAHRAAVRAVQLVPFLPSWGSRLGALDVVCLKRRFVLILSDETCFEICKKTFD